MSVHNLDKLFKPGSIAVIGASNRPGAIGALVMRNLLEGGFEGPIMPVNPKYKAVAGVLAYAEAADLPIVPDLAVICTPPATVPGLIETLGKRGTRAAIVLTAGLSREKTERGETLEKALIKAARRHQLRILGPNCLGLLVPGIKLNASFSHLPAGGGHIAFVSQSGAMCTAVLDWARSRGIGFSHFVSLGNKADVDFGDVIDYLGSDPSTRSILLYIEGIKDGRKFMSAARAAARNKPVLAIKAGRVAEGARAAASHTGALAGADEVYEAAIRRAGMLRVKENAQLFTAVETLARARPPRGDRLAILTNGGGIGVMAVDSLIEGGGTLARLSAETIAQLDAVLPATWSRDNPVDIIGDAPGERYSEAMKILLKAKEVDAVLVMHSPTATADSTEAAEAVIAAAKGTQRTVLTAWIGGDTVRPARDRFFEAGIPSYPTPEQATKTFADIIQYQRNQELLMETPAAVAAEIKPATDAARILVEGALAEPGGRGAKLMREPEAKAVLAAYGIPTVETHIAASPDDAVGAAEEIGFPVALKILSPDITHKTDVGGVALHLETPEGVRMAAEAMLERLGKEKPKARVNGFTVQEMANRPGAHELIAGATTDPVFGPVILFGEGGTAVEVIADRNIGLPPLNMTLARELVSRTRIARLLQGYRDRPAVDLDALCRTLIQVSQLIIDVPEIAELDINPLLTDQHGVLALDARIAVAHPRKPGVKRLAIRPYPQDLEEEFTMKSGRKVLFRPIRPEDEPQHHEFIAKLSSEDIHFRFFGHVRELPHSQMARFTQIDYDREMAFIATGKKRGGRPETLGVVRTVSDPDNVRTEFAIVVRSDLKGQGLGTALLVKMIDYCRARGTREMVGQILTNNRAMLGLAKRLGFERIGMIDHEAVEMLLDLQKPKR
ncbi:MAG: GNAT family N-acetyltransferase [Alphaproteobacteria bacterium]|nr:GNAT family N-acetyltransferase [Alphaproteobacteria bacterium]